MTASSAVTINRTVEEVQAILDQADPPVFEEGAVVAVTAAPGDQGAELRVRMESSPPGGAVGAKVASLVGAVTGSDPQRDLDDALRRLKQIIETGEVVVSDASPEGTDASRQRHQPAAEPAEPSKNAATPQTQEV